MSMQLVVKKILPVQRDLEVKGFGNPAGTTAFTIQQLAIPAVGLTYVDYREHHATHRIAGTIEGFEISNANNQMSHIFWTYITVRDVRVEALEYPILFPYDTQIVMTNTMTKARRVLGFERSGKMTYRKLAEQYGLVKSADSYCIQDAQGNLIDEVIVHKQPTAAFILPDAKHPIPAAAQLTLITDVPKAEPEPKLHCNYCGKETKWNPVFFTAVKDAWEREWKQLKPHEKGRAVQEQAQKGVHIMLNLDDSEHTCLEAMQIEAFTKANHCERCKYSRSNVKYLVGEVCTLTNPRYMLSHEICEFFKAS